MDHKYIVLIDDDPDDIEIFQEAVRKISSPFSCKAFRSGSLALSELENVKVPPIVIFIDHNMPGMNGSECLKIMRNMPSLQQVPVVVYSTSISESDRVYYRSLNADFLEKGFTWEKTVNDIDKTLKRWEP